MLCGGGRRRPADRSARAGYSVGGPEMIAVADYILLPLPLDAARTPLAELLQALLASVEAYPVYYLAVAALVALQFGCVIWFLASKRRLAFYILAAAAAVLTVMQLILGGGVGALVYILGPLAAWLMLRRSWSLLR